jgi:hypothetical protein
MWIYFCLRYISRESPINSCIFTTSLFDVVHSWQSSLSSERINNRQRSSLLSSALMQLDGIVFSKNIVRNIGWYNEIAESGTVGRSNHYQLKHFYATHIEFQIDNSRHKTSVDINNVQMLWWLICTSLDQNWIWDHSSY